jgi:catalase
MTESKQGKQVKQVLTTAFGQPVDDNQNSITAGPNGPVLMQDLHLLDKLAHFDRERIPERVVHAKGGGAYGYFEVTHDISKICKAKVFGKVGQRTPVFGRFSTVTGERGSADGIRNPRGFAIKHYTEEGIWDMVGNNTPIFFIRDPSKFPDFIHSQKRDPQTNLPYVEAFWDFASLVPESVHQFSFLFSDRGIPANFRQMDGFSSHTYKFVNAENEAVWVKMHYKTDAGIKNMTSREAAEICGNNPDHAVKDLFDTIAAGKQVSWTMYIQVMSLEEGKNYKWNIFDITKVWPHGDYPLQKVGKLVFNRNPENYFAEVEQAAFSPSNLVPGIEPSLDRMLQARLFSYTDTQRHRLGVNFMQIPINCPYKVANYQRDGFMVVNGNKGKEPNYEPNSFSTAPKQDPSFAMHAYPVNGLVARHEFEHPNDDYEQPRVFYRKVLDEAQRARMIEAIVDNLGQVTTPGVQERMVGIFKKVDPDYGKRVEEGLAKLKNKDPDVMHGPLIITDK